MESRPTQSNTAVIVVTLIGLMLVGGLSYYSYTLQEELSATRASTTAAILSLQEELASTKDQKHRIEEANNNLRQALKDKEEEVENLADKVGEIAGDVNVIKKVQNTDPELLKKYSKVYFLNENYFPSDLIEVPEEWLVKEDEDEYFHEKAWPFLEDMLEDAEDDGIDLRIISGFRTFDEQSSLKGHYKVTYGAGTANQFSADQGYSEHQLGTTLDFSTEELGLQFSQMESTEAYEWLQQNAYKYGFVLSYPQGNAYYQFEPWHWRFVGEELADHLHDENMHFYDMDQRDIDEYRAELFDD